MDQKSDPGLGAYYNPEPRAPKDTSVSDKIAEIARGLMGPAYEPFSQAAYGLLRYASPAADIADAAEANKAMVEALRGGHWGQAALEGANMLGAGAAMALPISLGALKNNIPEGFANVVHERPTIIGRGADHPGAHIAEEGFTYRSLSQGEIDAIRETGSALPPPGEKSKGGRKNVKHWARSPGRLYYRPDQLVIRVPNDRLQPNVPASAADIQLWDPSSNSFGPILSQPKTRDWDDMP